MTTMLTTLEGNTDSTEFIESDLYIADNDKVYYESNPNEYTELGSIQDIFGCEFSEFAGDDDFIELLDGDELALNPDDYLYIHQNGNVYFKSPLGGYSELGSIEEIFGNELSGLDTLEEVLDGDDFLNGFKFKMPKFKAPKLKLKIPKIKAPKINTKGITKTFKSATKAVSSAGKAIGKGVQAFSKSAGKAVSSAGKAIAKGASDFVKAHGDLLSQAADMLMPQEQIAEEQTEEQPEEIPQDEIYTEPTEEYSQEEIPQDENYTDESDNQSYPENEDNMTEEYTDEMSGLHSDEQGKKYYYSHLNGEYIELSGDELGFMQMLTSAAGMAAGGNKAGLANMATGALDMAVPGAGTIANIGLQFASQQKAKANAKKAQQKALQQNLLNQFIKKNTPVNSKPVITPKPKPVIQTSIPVKTQVKPSYPPNPTYGNTQVVPGAETGITKAEQDKKNQIMYGVGAVVVVAIIYSMNKKGRK